MRRRLLIVDRLLPILTDLREPNVVTQNCLVLSGLLAAMFISGIANAQSGGGYVVKKSTIDGGGVTFHTGGSYRLGGTVGQPDAGEYAGGSYRLSGGFWGPTEATPCPIPGPDPSPQSKSRFISFVAPACLVSPGGESALRVKLVSLHHVVPPYTGGTSVPFSSFEGQVRWVGPPAIYVESNASGTPFYSSSLQCTPYYQDWSTVGLLHVTGSAIVPSSVYEVENLAASCEGNEANCAAASSPLSIHTARWGDVAIPYNPPSLTVQPDFGDVSALVNKFKDTPGAPIKARALLVGEDSFGNITPAIMNVNFGFTHIAACVDAFKGKPYPHIVESCP